MITHVVLLQPKSEITDTEITTALDHVRAFQDAILGINDVQVVKNMSNYNQGFVKRFVDDEHLIAYAPHPAHQVVSEELQRISEKIIDFDIGKLLCHLWPCSIVQLAIVGGTPLYLYTFS